MLQLNLSQPWSIWQTINLCLTQSKTYENAKWIVYTGHLILLLPCVYYVSTPIGADVQQFE